MLGSRSQHFRGCVSQAGAPRLPAKRLWAFTLLWKTLFRKPVRNEGASSSDTGRTLKPRTVANLAWTSPYSP